MGFRLYVDWFLPVFLNVHNFKKIFSQKNINFSVLIIWKAPFSLSISKTLKFQVEPAMLEPCLDAVQVEPTMFEPCLDAVQVEPAMYEPCLDAVQVEPAMFEPCLDAVQTP